MILHVLLSIPSKGKRLHAQVLSEFCQDMRQILILRADVADKPFNMSRIKNRIVKIENFDSFGYFIK